MKTMNPKSINFRKSMSYVVLDVVNDKLLKHITVKHLNFWTLSSMLSGIVKRMFQIIHEVDKYN